ncbi:glycosyltransferase family 39 protein [Thermococcus sp. Bubb.Bath]|uniref:ArnT family glycosyltransferase n=1 Tax=Thermococcus sp. Bubb.Bath TaxID=1638242 RepID=UPI0016BCDE5B|nr:glycosyltransferase family 39 protein [Thermococcus sp. Bubb.Bath]NJF25935.1 phospholipid carrier-dependent glycosyltransferase [Thermococcus sp. Bubb.Bath]
MDRRDIVFLFPVAVYFLLRLPLLHPMNAYMDYDEGTYLLMARMINHGHLLYRDIYAVHPPLFYYLLALWLRIFGDTYVIGRLLSLTFGLFSILVAYFTGRELRDWKLGTAFSVLLAFDPLMVHMNTVVYHESSIEFFTLLSLYFFIRYFKEKRPPFAYLSLFVAGIGSTSKFTILPYLAALYLVLLLATDERLWDYTSRVSSVLFSPRQGAVIVLSYLLMVALVVVTVVILPSNVVRNILIVPGIHSITFLNQRVSVGILLAIWGVLLIYAFRLSYVRKLYTSIVLLLKRWREAFLLASFVILGKAIIELPLGLLISGSYLNQTYFEQGSRYSPIINLFNLFAGFLSNLQSSSPEFLYSYVPLLLLLAIYAFLRLHHRTSLNTPLANLGAANLLFYFFVAPVLPNMRFLYPMTLVFYLLLLDSIMAFNVPKRKLMASFTVFLLALSILDIGLVANMPAGKLSLAWEPHTKSLRDDLGVYLISHNISRSDFYSINPMTAYYLHLSEPPYYVDNFGLLYLQRNSGVDFLNTLREKNVSRVVVGTWAYAIEKGDATLMRNYGGLISALRNTSTLEFAESYSDGGVIELYHLQNLSRNLTFSTFKGKLSVIVGGVQIGLLYPIVDNRSFDERTVISDESNTYRVAFYSDNDGVSCTLLALDGGGFSLKCPNVDEFSIEFKKEPVLISNGRPAKEAVDEAIIALPNAAFNISGEKIEMKGSSLHVRGDTIKIKATR